MTPLADDVPVLAIDVGGTTIKAELVAGDVDGDAAEDRILASDQRPTPSGAAAVEAIAELGAELMAAPGIGRNGVGRNGVERAGVGLPGLVDRHQGVGRYSENIGWRSLAVADPLAERWAIPVRVDHDVTLAGWAEWQCGAGRGVDDLAFVSVGTGVSAAVVAGGRLIRGGAGQAGEMGHAIVRPDGPPCACGAKGCLEAVASAAAVVRAYESRAGQTVDGARAVLALAADDPVARAVMAEAVAALADGMASLTHVLAPSRIVVGGGFAQAGEAVLAPLREALADRCRIVPAPEVVPARFGDRAGVVGAALLARHGPIDEVTP